MPNSRPGDCRKGNRDRGRDAVRRSECAHQRLRPQNPSRGRGDGVRDALGARDRPRGARGMSRGAKVRIVAGIALIVAALLLAWRFYRAAPATADELILLLPDDASFSDARVQVWLDEIGR